MYVTRKYYQISSLGSIRGEARSERDFSSTQRGEGITSSFSLECSTRGIEFLPGFVLDRLWLSRPRSEERGSLHDLLLGGWNKPTTHGRTRCIVGSHLPCCKRYLTGVTECHLLLHQNSVSSTNRDTIIRVGNTASGSTRRDEPELRPMRRLTEPS